MPSIVITDTLAADITTPATGQTTMFVDAGVLNLKDSTGTVTPVGSGGTSIAAVTTDNTGAPYTALIVSGLNQTAIGGDAMAFFNDNVLVGNATGAFAAGAIAIGSNVFAQTLEATVIGRGATSGLASRGDACVVLGSQVTGLADGALCLGSFYDNNALPMSQQQVVTLWAKTTDATATTMFCCNTPNAVSFNSFWVPGGMSFIDLTLFGTDGTDFLVVQHKHIASATAFVGADTVTTLKDSGVTWTTALTHNGASGVDVQVTGEVGKTIFWSGTATLTYVRTS